MDERASDGMVVHYWQHPDRFPGVLRVRANGKELQYIPLPELIAEQDRRQAAEERARVLENIITEWMAGECDYCGLPCGEHWDKARAMLKAVKEV